MRIKHEKNKIVEFYFYFLSLIFLLFISGCSSFNTETENRNAKNTPPGNATAFENNSQSTVQVLPDEVASKICLEDKQKMIRYCYDMMDAYFNDRKTPSIQSPPMNLTQFDYDKVFITISSNGKMKESQFTPSSGTLPDQLFQSLRDVTLRSSGDKGSGEPLSAMETQDALIIIDFLFNRKKLEKNRVDYLKENIRPGIHAVEVKKDDKQVCFNSSMAVVNNYSIKKLLEELCKQAGLKKSSYLDPETEIYKYDTLSFMGDRTGDITDLVRYNILVKQGDINQEKILGRIKLGCNWFKENVNQDTGLLEYEYLPLKDKYSPQNHDTRKLAAAWALSELRIKLKDDSLTLLIGNLLDFYLKFLIRQDDFAYFKKGENPVIADNAFALMVLINLPEYPNSTDLIKLLSEGILHNQQDDGSYQTEFLSKKKTGVDYFPGEAMLSLMRLYQKTMNTKYLDSVEKAYPYYRDYWRKHKNSAFVPWHSQVYFLLYKETKNKEVAEFVFEMNDWLIEKYQIFESPCPDEIGGAPKDGPGISTSTFMEGIADAYQLALMAGDDFHAKQYLESLRKGTRFIFQLQYTPENTFFLKSPKKAIGGFRFSLLASNTRCDNTQHSALALMKVLESGIFD